jgi:aarF domain-containing kinase
VHRTINRDIKIMSFFAKLINLLPGAEWLSFPEEVEVFAEMMYSQLDLRNEANNLQRFEDNFRSRRAALSFPRPLKQFSTRELLIEEFEDALPLKHFLDMGGGAFDHRIANLGLDAFLVRARREDWCWRTADPRACRTCCSWTTSRTPTCTPATS